MAARTTSPEKAWPTPPRSRQRSSVWPRCWATMPRREGGSMQTVHDLVRLAASRAANRIAIVDDRSGRRPTYAALLAEIDRVAAGLAGSGIAAGDRVATCLPNIYDHALALLALDRLGAVPALINARLKPDEVGALIRL